MQAAASVSIELIAASIKHGTTGPLAGLLALFWQE
jgi:hypothetical protein